MRRRDFICAGSTSSSRAPGSDWRQGWQRDACGIVFVAQSSNRLRCTVLGDHVAGTALAAAALSGYTQLELNFVKAHTGTRMSRNVTVRDPVANTDDHGSRLSTKGDGTGLNYKYELFAFAMYIFDQGQSGSRLCVRSLLAKLLRPDRVDDSRSGPWRFPVRLEANAVHGPHRWRPRWQGHRCRAARSALPWRPGPWP